MARILVASNDLTAMVEIFTDVDGDGANTGVCRGSACAWTSASRPYDPVEDFVNEAGIHIDIEHPGGSA